MRWRGRIQAVMVLLAMGFRPGFSWGEERERPAYDWPAMKAVWEQRIRDIRARGVTPIFDVESSYGVPWERPEDARLVLAALDGPAGESGIAAVGFEAAWLGAIPPESRRPEAYAALFQTNRRLAADGRPWFLPVPPCAWTAGAPPGGRRRLFNEILRDGYPIMGEFYLLRYPNNKFALGERSQASGPMSIPLDSPGVKEVFEFSQRHGVPFLIHLEAEDKVIVLLEGLLERFPGAKVIWSHLGRVRLPGRAKNYAPARIGALLKRFPGLYFDTSCISRGGRYPPAAGVLESVVWDAKRRHLAPEWKALIESQPWRFMSALDMSARSPGSEPSGLVIKVAQQREFLAELSPRTAQIVAYGAAWKLIFGEDLVGPDDYGTISPAR